MNWTAWNSVCAKAETKSPSAVPRTASATATSVSSQTGPSTSSPRNPTLIDTASTDWTVATSPNARAYPTRKSSLPIGMASSRSRVPRDRSRSVVTW